MHWKNRHERVLHFIHDGEPTVVQICATLPFIPVKSALLNYSCAYSQTLLRSFLTIASPGRSTNPQCKNLNQKFQKQIMPFFQNEKSPALLSNHQSRQKKGKKHQTSQKRHQGTQMLARVHFIVLLLQRQYLLLAHCRTQGSLRRLLIVNFLPSKSGYKLKVLTSNKACQTPRQSAYLLFSFLGSPVFFVEIFLLFTSSLSINNAYCLFRHGS